MRARKRILLVDNDADRRSVNRFVLGLWGYSYTLFPFEICVEIEATIAVEGAA